MSESAADLGEIAPGIVLGERVGRRVWASVYRGTCDGRLARFYVVERDVGEFESLERNFADHEVLARILRWGHAAVRLADPTHEGVWTYAACEDELGSQSLETWRARGRGVADHVALVRRLAEG